MVRGSTISSSSQYFGGNSTSDTEHAAPPGPARPGTGQGKVGAVWHAARHASLGIEMAIATAIGGGIGYWLDQSFGTEPWLLLVFLCFGVAAGFKGVIRATREVMEADRESDVGDQSDG